MSDKIEKQETTNEEIIERVKTTLKENPNSLYLMKKGDYSVHVLIEEIKNLIPKGNSEENNKELHVSMKQKELQSLLKTVRHIHLMNIYISMLQT